MRIHPISDLHLNCAPFRPIDEHPLFIDADVVVVAGDVTNGPGAVSWLKRAFADKPVVYVPGNHEYYGTVMPEALARMRAEAAGTNVHLLDKDEVVIDGVRFLGATLWTDFQLDGAEWSGIARLNATNAMNDFRLIEIEPGRRFTPADSMALHEVSRQWLRMKLSEPFAGETVVVSHHGCSRKSVHPRWCGDLLNAAFVSNLDEDLLGRCRLVIHGHTHDSFDYEVEGTRVVVNPRGYAQSNFHSTRPLGAPVVEKCENSSFDPYLVIEI